jgi:hypothetical protein
MRNYYTFLYGLPMKLTDPGTIIDPVVVKKEFMGKEYLVLKSNMKGSKRFWYFYFDPKPMRWKYTNSTMMRLKRWRIHRT